MRRFVRRAVESFCATCSSNIEYCKVDGRSMKSCTDFVANKKSSPIDAAASRRDQRHRKVNRTIMMAAAYGEKKHLHKSFARLLTLLYLRATESRRIMTPLCSLFSRLSPLPNPESRQECPPTILPFFHISRSTVRKPKRLVASYSLSAAGLRPAKTKFNARIQSTT